MKHGTRTKEADIQFLKNIEEEGRRGAWIVGEASIICIDSIKDKYFGNGVYGKLKRLFSRVTITGLAGYEQHVRNWGKYIGEFRVGKDAYVKYCNDPKKYT